MIIRKFLEWSGTVGARDRARAANALGKAYARSALSEEDARAAEAAMAMLLDDPSPIVRMALAEALAVSEYAPRAVIHKLARDQVDIAALVVSHSPVLKDSDLVDLAADSSPGLCRAIAMRHNLSAAVCAAVGEVGARMAVLELLDNMTARIASITLRRIVERFGVCGEIRARLIERSDLPPDVRHALIIEVGNALADAPFVARVLGCGRIRSVTSDACQTATLELASIIDTEETPALVEHLRIAGKLTPAFLMHTLCVGNIDFFAAAVASISGVEAQRVRGLLVEGKRNAIEALYRSCDLESGICDVFISATLLWRNGARGAVHPTALKITDELMHRHGSEGDQNVAELMLLVEKLNLSFHRQAAREYATALTRSAA